MNSECASGEVCGRDKACADPSEVREVTVTWTVNGMQASSASCAQSPEFTLTFLADDFGDEVAFTPVPCQIGQFFVDRLPRRFHTVELGTGGSRVPISGSGTATGDLRL
ncbi:MAG: hypothetical protein ACKV2T_43030 [Kofleriaceae bacterium]